MRQLKDDMPLWFVYLFTGLLMALTAYVFFVGFLGWFR